MGTNLTIFQKGLILIAVPVLFQLVFLGALYKMEWDEEEVQHLAVHTKEVIAQTETAYRSLLEATAYVRRLVITGEDTSQAPPLHDTLIDAPAEFEKLKQLVVDNPPQQGKVIETAADAEGLRRHLADALASLTAGRRDEAAARVKDPEVQRLLDAVRLRLDDFLREEARLDGVRMTALTDAWRRQNWLIGGGVAASVLIALAVAALFSRGVTGRFARLTENVGRLADKKELTQPLSGTDEIAHLDAAFHTMASALREREQENEMFIYSVSHDLRSPLVNLQGFSEELSLSCRELRAALDASDAALGPARTILDRDIPDSVKYIRTSVTRLSGIIDALLRLSRAGRVEYQIRPVDVNLKVGRVVEALAGAVKARKAEVIVGDLPPALADPTAVEQIFANLIGNAVNYLDPARPGRVEVGALEPGAGAAPAGLRTYYVRDNGLGVPAEYQERIFRAFKRLHANSAPGEGVGLALVSRMVGRLGGKIWLESAAGAGSTFFVALPAAPEGAVAPSAGGKDIRA